MGRPKGWASGDAAGGDAFAGSAAGGRRDAQDAGGTSYGFDQTPLTTSSQAVVLAHEGFVRVPRSRGPHSILGSARVAGWRIVEGPKEDTTGGAPVPNGPAGLEPIEGDQVAA
jgi:hypothetical protein